MNHYSVNAIGRPFIFEDMGRITKIFEGVEDLSAPDCDGLTFMHKAVIYGRENEVSYLLKNNCEINAQDLLGRTPLMLAIKGKNERIMQALLAAGADMFILNHKSKSALHKLFKNQSLEPNFCKIFLQELCKRCSSSEELAQKMIDAGCVLYQAAYSKNAEVIECMLKKGISIDSAHPQRLTTALHIAVMLEDVESVKVLLKYGVFVNAVDDAGFSPLYYLYKYNVQQTAEKVSILEILLNSRARPMSYTRHGTFQIGPTLMKGNLKAIRLVFQSDVNLKVKDRRRKNILHYLAKNTDSVEELKRHITKFNINEVDNTGISPLHVAILHSNFEMVKLLLSHGAETNRQVNLYSFPPLFYCFLTANSPSQNTNKKIIELLLEHNADPQFVATTPAGLQKTIFDLAREAGNIDRMHLVIAHLAIFEGLGAPITKLIHSKIKSHDTLDKYFKRCRQLLKKNIVDSSTILKLLNADKIKMSQHLRNRNLALKLKRLSYRQKLKSLFPHYWNMMSQRFSKGNEYRKLKDNAAGVISKLFEDRIHKTDLIIDKTMEYLNEQDLQKLCQLQELI